MARDHLTLLPADADPDPRRRIATYGLPPGIETHYPLPMQIGRELLCAVVEDNLAAIAKNVRTLPEEQLPEAEAYRDQLRAFLGWLHRYPAVNVWCNVAPAPLDSGL